MLLDLISKYESKQNKTSQIEKHLNITQNNLK